MNSGKPRSLLSGPVAGVLLACLALLPTVRAEITVSARVEPNPLPLGESGQLLVVVEGSQKAEPPVIQGNDYLQIAYRGPSTQVAIVNGEMTATLTHIFQIQPNQMGKFRISPLTVVVDGKSYQTDEFILEVVKGAPGSIDIGRIAWLEFDLPDRDVFVGETISTQLRMVMLNKATFPNRGLPQVEGDAFSIPPIDTEPDISRRIVEGRYYDVYTWDLGITPVKSGSQTLQFQSTHILRIPESPRGNRRDPFNLFGNDPLFGNVFGRYQDKQIVANSQPASLTIQPHPEDGRPDNFNGAIGSFSIAASTESGDLVEGDPITLRIDLSGEGNFSQLIPPEFPTGHQFKTYPPRVLEEDLDKQHFRGTKSFEYVVIPLSASITDIPGIEFAFLHPETGAYREVSTPPIPLSISAARSVASPLTAASFTGGRRPFPGNQLPDGVNLLPIKISLGSTVVPPTHERIQHALIAGALAPALILGLAFFLKRSRQLARQDQEKIRLKSLEEKILFHRGRMRKARQQKDALTFYGEGCRALQAALARQLGCNPEAITEKEIGSLWVPSLGDDEMKRSVQEFFRKVDALRYSGAAAGEVSLENEERDLESKLRQLDGKS
ncbi:MAG: hypothetical protein F7O42_07010 [Opitutae bacterium]|nr:hypothetical protein [Opitutae bacterium]